MKRIVWLSLILVLGMALAACGGAAEPTPTPEPEPTAEPTAETEEMGQTIVDIAVADGRFNTLVTAVTEAGLAETLAGEGSFTVFAPTDDAFAALPEGTLEGLLADPEGALTDVLLYHVVDGAVLAADVVGLESVTPLQGEEITISVDGDTVMLNDSATVIMTDIEASNGVIHVIDAVILPPSMSGEEEMMDAPSIAEIAAGDENFSTLVAALDAAGLVETLAGEGEFTVFAPTNAAFEALPEGTVDALLEDPSGDLTSILLYHVAEGIFTAEDVVGVESIATLNGAEIIVSVEDGNVILDGVAMVTMTDIEASNGIVHVIDAVLLPPSMMTDELPSIAEIAAGDESFSTLVTALEAAGLVDTLAGEGSFTVFAPTNDAFAALEEGVLTALLDDPQGALNEVLLYHVVEGEVPAETVVTLDAATTLLGQDVTITVTDEGGVVLNDTVNVVTTDIMASNGIIHVIDGVLIPSDEAGDEDMGELLSIAEIAAADENFSTLVTALDAAGLVETLAGEGSFTVFAPTNDAFDALEEGTLPALLEDPTGDLNDILLYHVVDGAVTSDVVVTLDSATTLQGGDITITITDDGGVVLNDTVNVVTVDIMASNGVIHVIDAVLLP